MPEEQRRTPPGPPQTGFRPGGAGTAAGGWRIPAPRRPDRPAAGEPTRTANGRSLLSERDLILVRRLAIGGSVADVAAALAVSRNTARTRIRRVEAKLALPDRGRLAVAARSLGLG